MPSTLQQLLEDVLDNLEDSGDLISSVSGQLDEDERSVVAEHLDVALLRIEEAISQLDAPGGPDVIEPLTDLNGVAEQCTALARELFDPTGRPCLPEEQIAGKLHTIKVLIEQQPGGFRSLAGLS